MCAVGVGAYYTPRSSVFISRSRPQTPERIRPVITVSTRLSMTSSSFDASTEIHFRSPVRPSPDPDCSPGSGIPLDFSGGFARLRYQLRTRRMATGPNTIPGSFSSNHSLHATSCRTGRDECTPGARGRYGRVLPARGRGLSPLRRDRLPPAPALRGLRGACRQAQRGRQGAPRAWELARKEPARVLHGLPSGAGWRAQHAGGFAAREDGGVI